MARLTALTFPGGYKIPETDIQVSVAVTNKSPWNASRGYGKEATALLLEHVCDRIASSLDVDPADVRHQNFVQPHEFPFKANSGLNLDSGDYSRRRSRWPTNPALRARQREARTAASPGALGIGLAFEVTPEGADLPGRSPAASTRRPCA